MSGIDEYIIGASFIETKPRPLPWDDHSKDNRDDAIEASSKATNNDIFGGEEGVINETENPHDQGIVAKGKAEDILTKITLGDFKLQDITFTSKKRQEVEGDSNTVTKIVDIGLDDVPNYKKSFNPNKAEGNKVTKIVDVGLDDAPMITRPFTFITNKSGGNKFDKLFGAGLDGAPQSTRSFTYTPNKAESNTLTKIDVGLGDVPIDTKPFSYTPSKLEQFTNYKTMSGYSLNTGKAVEVECVKSDESLTCTDEPSLGFGRSYRPSFLEENASAYTTKTSLISDEKVLIHERNKDLIMDIDRLDERKIPTIAGLSKQDRLVQHDAKRSVNEQISAPRESAYNKKDNCNDILVHEKSSIDKASERRLSFGGGASKEVSSLIETSYEIDCVTVLEINEALQYGGNDNELREVKVEGNTEELGKEMDEGFSNNELAYECNKSTDYDTRKSCSTEIGAKKTNADRRPLLTANVIATDHSERKSRNGRKNVNTEAKHGYIYKAISGGTIRMTNDVLDHGFEDAKTECNTDKQNREPDDTIEKIDTGLSVKALHKTKGVMKYSPTQDIDHDTSRTKKEPTVLMRKSVTGLSNKNLRVIGSVSSPIETRRRKMKKQRERKVRIETSEGDNVQSESEVFDITPVKDIPWSPCQDGVDVIRNTEPANKRKAINKKAKKSKDAAQPLDIEDVMSQHPNDPTTSNDMPSLRRIEHESHCTETRHDNSVEVMYGVATEMKRGRREFNIDHESNKTTQSLVDDDHSKLVNTKLLKANRSVVRVKSDTRDSNSNLIDTSDRWVDDKYGPLINDVDDQIDERIRKRKEKIKRIVQKEIDKFESDTRMESANNTHQKQDIPNVVSDIIRNTVLKKGNIDSYHSNNEIRENGHLYNMNKPIIVQDVCEFNTGRSPINVKYNEDTTKDISKHTIGVAQTTQHDVPTTERLNEDIVESLSPISLHYGSRADEDDTNRFNVNKVDDTTGNDNKGSRWRRFLNWISCCLKPKVDD